MKTPEARQISLIVALALGAAGILLAVGVAGAAVAGDEDQPVYSAVAGSLTFRNYCANCHGPEGKGDGYIVETLSKKPGDLTQLAAGNGGLFPIDRVRATIDGTVEVKSHGRREMPLWGDIFLWPENDSAERRLHVQRKIGELVEHLRAMQAPAEKK